MIRMYQFPPTFHYQAYLYVSCEVKYETDNAHNIFLIGPRLIAPHGCWFQRFLQNFIFWH